LPAHRLDLSPRLGEASLESIRSLAKVSARFVEHILEGREQFSTGKVSKGSAGNEGLVDR
jgi:hypothetical protein